ncbi:MAG TPA: hypothetical protein DDY89_11650 [Lysinibacillus sp.]|nr:hypothetical protein [Lysinibacillus sp.]
MKNLKKRSSVAIFGLIVAGFVNFTPSKSEAQELRSFSNCWGSGAAGVSCSNGNATVYGCEGDPGSYCMGALREGQTT